MHFHKSIGVPQALLPPLRSVCELDTNYNQPSELTLMQAGQRFVCEVKHSIANMRHKESYMHAWPRKVTAGSTHTPINMGRTYTHRRVSLVNDSTTAWYPIIWVRFHVFRDLVPCVLELLQAEVVLEALADAPVIVIIRATSASTCGIAPRQGQICCPDASSHALLPMDAFTFCGERVHELLIRRHHIHTRNLNFA